MENSKCKMCLHYAPCKAWVKHGEILYDDFSYSTEGCMYFAMHYIQKTEVFEEDLSDGSLD